MAPPLEQMSSMVLGFTKGEAPATPSVSRNHARARRFQNDDVRRVCIARDYGGDIGPTATFLRNGGCRSGHRRGRRVMDPGPALRPADRAAAAPTDQRCAGQHATGRHGHGRIPERTDRCTRNLPGRGPAQRGRAAGSGPQPARAAHCYCRHAGRLCRPPRAHRWSCPARPRSVRFSLHSRTPRAGRSRWTHGRARCRQRASG